MAISYGLINVLNVLLKSSAVPEFPNINLSTKLNKDH